MGSRLKEEEKNERIIRGLAKLPANRRCINCNIQGTQYVCTNFATFICIHCSGVHREFTHRVKSISMANFTSQEITALQEGGNERAKRIYFKEWDFERYTLPDNSDANKLRDFIKHVYVDHRFMGDKNTNKSPLIKGSKNSNSKEKEEEAWIKERSNGAPNSHAPSPPKNVETNSDKNVPPVREVVHAVVPKLNKPGPPNVETNSESNSDNKKGFVSNTQVAPEVSKQSVPQPQVSLIDFDFDFDPVRVTKQQTANSANENKDVGWANFDTNNVLNPPLVHRPSPGPGPATNHANVVPTNQIWGQRQEVGPNMHTTRIGSNHQGSQQFMNGPGAPPNQTPASSSVPMVYGGPPPGWQGAPGVITGYPLQYTTPHPSNAYSSNPFDVSTEPKLSHSLTFPSMSSIQGALPNPNPNALSRTYNMVPNPNPNPNPNSLSRAYSMVPMGSQWVPQVQYIPQQMPSYMFYNGNQVMGLNPQGYVRNPQPGNGNPFS